MRIASPWAAALAAGLWASVACGQATGGDTAEPIVTVHIGTDRAVMGTVEAFAERYHRAHPNVTLYARSSTFNSPTGLLVTGEAELAVVYGGPDIYQYEYRAEPKQFGRLKDVFKPGELKTHLLGRLAVAMAVHPQCALKDVSEDEVRGLLMYDLGVGDDPLASFHLRYAQADGSLLQLRPWLLGDAMKRRSTLHHIRFPRGPEIADLLPEAAAKTDLLVFCRLTDAIWSSGLRVLPVRTADGQRVLPTPGHVLSGQYPYANSLLLVVHPKASATAREVAKALLDPEVRADLTDHGWITPETPEPGRPHETIWPAPMAALPPPTEGSVAVLPARQLSTFFRMAPPAVQAKYEDDITAGIARAKRLTLVGRTQLCRVLAEKTLSLSATSDPQPKPLVTADILVLIQIISRETVAYLRIEAFHAGTASCIGLLELPIDAAHPTDFARPLEDLVADWWPGVVVHLARARKGPIWTLTEDGPAANAAATAAVRTSAEDCLAARSDLFFARYHYVPAAQREVLMRLMGLARSSDGKAAVAADYVVVLGTEAGAPHLVLRRSKDRAVVAEQTFRDGADPAAWLKAQIDAVAGGGSSGAGDEDPAARQALEEFQRGSEILKQWKQLEVEAGTRRWRANRDDYFPEDKARLDELERQMTQHFERAIQLNPTAEAAAYENINLMIHKTAGKYLSVRDITEACLAFIDQYPRSPHICMVMEQSYWGLSSLCGALEDTFSQWAEVPPDLDRTATAKRYRRQLLGVLAAYMRRFIADPEQCRDHMYDWGGMTAAYQQALDRYAEIATAAELNEALDEYGAACDAWPERMPHSDFLRLRYAARRGDKAAYLALLNRLQQRWNDPAHPQWKRGGDDVVREMDELFQMDMRRNSLYQWFQGRHGPGDLPYVGYRPEPATRP